MANRHSAFLGGLSIIILLVLAACGSTDPTATTVPTQTPDPTPTVTPEIAATEVPLSAGDFDLTETQVLEGFGFSIDYPAGWSAETIDDVTRITEVPMDPNQPPPLGPFGGPPGYEVTFQYAPQGFLQAAGLPEEPSLQNLLALVARDFGWQIIEESEVSLFGQPALSATIRSPVFSAIAVIGFRNEGAYVLQLIAPDEGARDEFLPVWSKMLESIEPVEEAPLTVDEQYFQDGNDGLNLANAIFTNFGAIFSRTYETRQRLIDALLEGGVDTAFSPTVEALEIISPPGEFAVGHQILSENRRSLQRLDLEAAQAVRDGDMARFVLINGQLGEVQSILPRSLPSVYCIRLFEGPNVSQLCGPSSPLPDGEYISQLSQLPTEIGPAFAGAMGSFGFPVSLTPEENLVVLKEAGPKAAMLLEEIKAQVEGLEPPAELVADQDLLIQKIDEFLEIFARALSPAEADNAEFNSMSIVRTQRSICESPGTFSSPEFSSLVQALLLCPPG